jgi:hypothetical protein
MSRGNVLGTPSAEALITNLLCSRFTQIPYDWGLICFFSNKTKKLDIKSGPTFCFEIKGKSLGGVYFWS